MAEAVVGRLEAVAGRLEQLARTLGRKGGGGDGDDDEVPQYVEDFAKLISGPLAALNESAKALQLPEVGELMSVSYSTLLALIKKVPSCKKPTPQELAGALSGVTDAINRADHLSFRGKKKFGDHFKAYKEALSLLAWITVAPPYGTPAVHADSQVSATDFNLNRVLKVAKEKSDEAAKTWVNAFKALNKQHAELVKEYFKKGVEWKIGGSALGDVKADAGAASAGASEAKSSTGDAKEEKTDQGMALKNMMGELTKKGAGVTSGLKKVTAGMKSKNRKDKSSTVKASSGPAKKIRAKGPASFKLQGVRWVAMNQTEELVTVDKAKLSDSVALIMGDHATYDVQSKVKAVSLDSCNKCKLFTNEIVSTIELINCKSVTIVCRDVVPSMTVEKSESVQIMLMQKAYLAKPNIYTSNITALNIEVPGKSADDQMVEHSVPEQFLVNVDPASGQLSIAPTVH